MLFFLEQLIAATSAEVHRPYSLALYDNFLYWTEINQGRIQRLWLGNGSEADGQPLPVPASAIESNHVGLFLFDVKLFDNSSQTGAPTTHLSSLPESY